MAIEKLILWRPLYKTTVVMYCLVFLLALPAPKIATLLLFAIVAMWSRVPAVMTMFTKDVEVVDFFTVMIALNMGPLIAGIFGFSIIFFTKFFGPSEPWDYTIRDALAFFVGGFTTVAVYAITGQNITITMFAFTVVRYTMYPILGLLINPAGVFYDVFLLMLGAPVAVISNLLLLNTIEPTLNKIFAKGTVVSWELFVFVTLTILIIFLFSKFLDKEEAKRMTYEQKPQKQEEQTVVSGLAYAPEPHEAFFMLFDVEKHPMLLSVTKKLFVVFITGCFFFLIVVANYTQGGLGLFELIVLPLALYFLIYILYSLLDTYLVKKNKQFI